MQGQKPPLSYGSRGSCYSRTHPAQARPCRRERGPGPGKRRSSGERARARCSTHHPSPRRVGSCLAAGLRAGRRARDREEPLKLGRCWRRVRAPDAEPCRARPALSLLPPPRPAPAQPPESVQLSPFRLRIPPVPPPAASPLGASAQPRAAAPTGPVL